MSEPPGKSIGRRSFIATLLGLLGVVVIGGVAYEVPRRLYGTAAATPFDDLLDRLPDRDNARRFGAAVLARGGQFDVSKTAHRLRAQLDATPLSAVLDADVSKGRVAEVKGWVVPETLAELCALAAISG